MNNAHAISFLFKNPFSEGNETKTRTRKRDGNSKIHALPSWEWKNDCTCKSSDSWGRLNLFGYAPLRSQMAVVMSDIKRKWNALWFISGRWKWTIFLTFRKFHKNKMILRNYIKEQDARILSILKLKNSSSATTVSAIDNWTYFLANFTFIHCESETTVSGYIALK